LVAISGLVVETMRLNPSKTLWIESEADTERERERERERCDTYIEENKRRNDRRTCVGERGLRTSASG
jgi:hypothetical protein